MGGNFGWEETSHFFDTPLGRSYILCFSRLFEAKLAAGVFTEMERSRKEKIQRRWSLWKLHISVINWSSQKKREFNGSSQKKNTQQHPEKTRIFWPTCFAPSLLQRHNQCLWISHHLRHSRAKKTSESRIRITRWKFDMLRVSYIVSGQNIIFHQPQISLK